MLRGRRDLDRGRGRHVKILVGGRQSEERSLPWLSKMYRVNQNDPSGGKLVKDTAAQVVRLERPADDTTGVILFAGRISDPSKTN